MCWKSETALRDLPPDMHMTWHCANGRTLWTTPRELMNQGRISGALCLDHLEFAFDAVLEPAVVMHMAPQPWYAAAHA